MNISVQVKLHAKEEKVTRVDENNFIVSIRVIPEKGKANQAVMSLLADFLQVPKSRLHIIRGMASRTKVIEIL